jgi:hypothetical protein
VSPEPLVDQVRALLTRVVDAHAADPAVEPLRHALAALDQPLLVAIAGKVKAGKSTLLNALVGEELAPTDAGECTKIVTWYEDGVTYRVTLHPRDGLPEPVRFRREAGALEVDLGTRSADEVERLVVEWPSASLRGTTLIDTPGIGSLSAEVSARTEAFFGRDDERPATADAVLYLMRHLHSTDVDFLEAFRDETGDATPVNAIGVLSRADELSGGRPDGMASAAQVAARYRKDPKIRRLCQTVVPVAGLLAQAGVTLTEENFRALGRIAQAAPAAADALLLTADRFLYSETEIAVSKEERAVLLGAFGLFGVRLAVTLLRDGTARSAPELARELVARSGVGELRGILGSGFVARRDVLKARSALRALDGALREPSLAADVDAALDLERIVAGAHEFAEMNLLDECRGGAAPFRDDELDEVERLLGASGPSAAERLGLPAGADPAAVREALGAAALKWQTRAESPMSSRDLVDAARVLVRTCEGLAAAATQP